MAERHLRDSDVPPEQWDGVRFRYAENLENQMWASVAIEVERRGAGWIVTRLDRNRGPVSDPGFARLA